MGVNCMATVRTVNNRACHCPACPRASPPALALPPMALEEAEHIQGQGKDKKGSKMKVLKKIKKKMGLAPRSTCTSGTPNNLPPLGFHRVHGENVRVSRDGSTARRVESFCKGVAFSSRPVRVNEKVCLCFAEISNNWSGVLRFGFTSHDPATLANCLPKYACPDLTNKPGYWAKALAERFCEKDNLLYYYVNSSGDVHFGINGEDKGIFFSGVDTRNPIWALVDVYGNCTAIQFADPRAPSQRRSLTNEDDRLAGSLRSLNLDDTLPAPRFQSQPVVPLNLHRTKGRNVRFISDRGVAARVETEFCQGYVFTARPMRPGETLVVQILATENAYAGSLAIGLTSCDPATLRPSDLPDDPEQLLDRPEYWVVRRDAASGLRRGDEMAVTLTLDGEVRVARNGSNPATVMHVDHTLRLWAFVDIYGATTKVRLLSTTVPQNTQSPGLRVQLAGTNGLPAPNGGTVLVVSLPPQNGGQNAANQQALTLASAHYIEPIQQPSLCLAGLSPPTTSYSQPTTSLCMSTAYNSPSQSYNQNHLNSQPHTTNSQNLPTTYNNGQNMPTTYGQQMPILNQTQPVFIPSQNQPINQLILSQICASTTQNNANVLADLPTSSNQAINEPLRLSNGLNLGPSSSHSSHTSLAHSSHSGQSLPHSSQNMPHSSQNLPHSSQNLPHSSQNLPHSNQIVPHSGPHFAHSNVPLNHQPLYSVIGDIPNGLTGTECSICYENPIDSVLYMCGHMCMCYRCAVQQWRGKGGGQCPLCRAHIKDVIRTYKS